ncbi:hypothetical protein CK204_27275, partial [Klebsiella pneumoniae]
RRGGDLVSVIAAVIDRVGWQMGYHGPPPRYGAAGVVCLAAVHARSPAEQAGFPSINIGEAVT